MQANQSARGPEAAPGNPVTWQVVVQAQTNTHPETQRKPKRRRGATARTCTSIFQASLGAILIVAGIIVISVVIQSSTRYPRFDYSLENVDMNDRQSWGIWCGALFIFTSVLGFMSRRSQVMISLYMGFSIFAALLAFSGIIFSSVQIVHLKVAISRLGYGFSSYGNPCRPLNMAENTNITECVISYYHYSRCVAIHEVERCIEEMQHKLTAHKVFYAIMLSCFVLEFIISIVGASFTCIGLECCCQTQQRQHIVYYQSRATQFAGQPGVPPGAHVFPPHPYPLSMPPPAGVPIAAVPLVVQQTSPSGEDEYSIPDAAPPPYQPQADQQEYAYAAEKPCSQSTASAPPSYL